MIDIADAGAVDEVVSLAHTLIGTADGDSRNRFWSQRAERLMVGMTLETLQ